jgi:hypothetical protein
MRKFGRISEKSAASAKYLKNPRRRIVLVNDLLQIDYFPAMPSSSISASSFDLKNYILVGRFDARICFPPSFKPLTALARLQPTAIEKSELWEK